MKFEEYTIKDAAETLEFLKSSENGLTEKEALDRLQIHGLNEAEPRPITFFGVFLRQFQSPFFYLLLAASIIALLMGQPVDALVVLAFIAINVSLGFFQEAKAEKAVMLLKKYLPSQIKVLREKTEKFIDKKFLVPGILFYWRREILFWLI